MKKARKPLFEPGSVYFGVTPTSWWNDDFLDIDIGIPYQQAFSEMALAGYEGCSQGHKYPEDLEVLKFELGLRGLRISEPWTSTFFTINKMRDKTIADFRASLAFIKAMGGTDMVVAELGQSSHQRPVDLVANRPIFKDPEWESLADGLNELGAIATAEGMRLCYHHHMGTGVMTLADVRRLMAMTNPGDVRLLLDTGHLTYAGDDPLECIAEFGHRLGHVHLKNIRRPAMEEALAQGMSFHDAIEHGVFTVPGDPAGCLDFEAILKALAAIPYKGWMVVEAEQNPAKANPLQYVKMARDYLREVTGL
ncbi:MAG: myo-inosose-2 dehydratase [Myxococcales bacterium]|nr:myo-inosose-2 dehydratase [Myxococcales bacterium]MCB9525823.1 myo-inosose-2 dehydratase [Myxococcales bacterium]